MKLIRTGMVVAMLLITALSITLILNDDYSGEPYETYDEDLMLSE